MQAEPAALPPPVPGRGLRHFEAEMQRLATRAHADLAAWTAR